MGRYNIGRYEIRKISNESVAKYINKTFNSDEYKDIIKAFNSRDEAIDYQNNLGDILCSYICSTGDLTKSSAYKIMKEYYCSKLSMEDFYFYKVVPLSLQKLGYICTSISIKDMIDILNHLYLHSKNNQFFTHSFNGALYDNINADGLDINKSLFEDDFRILSIIGDSPYQKNKLFLTNLGYHTFSYAVYPSERLSMILSDSTIKRNDNESLKDYYYRCLDKKTESAYGLQKRIIMESGTKLIDYYTNAFVSGISVIEDKTSYDKPLDFISHLYTCSLKLKSSLYSILKNDKDIANRYHDLLISLVNHEHNCLDKLVTFKVILNNKYKKGYIIDKLLKEFFRKSIINYCLNNFAYKGNEDGYEVKRGIVERRNMSIVLIPNVDTLYTSKYKLEQKVRM